MAKKKYKVKGKLGSGSRFRNLKRTLAGRKGVTNPGGLAAYIGRRKLGKAGFQKLAAAGRKRAARKSSGQGSMAKGRKMASMM